MHAMKPSRFNRNYIQVDGLRLCFYDSGGDHPFIFFLHGWAEHSQPFQKPFLPLTSTHRVVLIDLPSHGRSGTAQFHWGYTEFGDIIARAIKRIAGDSVVILGGHSLGGGVAIQAASILGDQVCELVLVNSTGVKMQASRKEIIQKSLKAILAQLRHSKNYRAYTQTSLNAIAHFITRTRAMWHTSWIPFQEDVSHLLPDLSAKIHLFWSDGDPVTSLSLGKQMAQICGVDLMVIEPDFFHEWMILYPDLFAEKFKKNVLDELS